MAVNEDRTTALDPGTSLGKGTLGTWGIVFMVFAAMSPLVGLSSTTGLALAFGGGIGIVGLYVVVAACVLLFQVGYSAMSTEITNAGAFYAYISRGFGRVSGLAASLLSTLYYIMITVVLTAFFSFYASVTLSDQLGIAVPWQLCAVVSLALVFILGRLNLNVSSTLLGIAVVLETRRAARSSR